MRSESNDSSGRDLVALGRIVKPVGLKGDVVVVSFGATIESLHLPCGVILSSENGDRDTATLLEARAHGSGFTCRFSGIEDREQAETLRNRMVSLEEKELPQLAAGKYYHFELEGMDVVSVPDGRVLGKVKAVHDYPTTDALEVDRKGYPSILIPLSGEAVERIDRERKTVFVRSEVLEELL